MTVRRRSLRPCVPISSSADSGERLDALGPLGRDAMLLEMPDAERAKTRTMCELFIDCEEDKVLRAVLVGMLREGD